MHSVNELIGVSGLLIAPYVPEGSELNFTTAVGAVQGLGVETLDGAVQCFDAANALVSQARLLIEALPPWEDILAEVGQMSAAILATVIESALPVWAADIVAGLLSFFWSDFETVWAAHSTQVSTDLGRVGLAAILEVTGTANVSQLLFNIFNGTDFEPLLDAVALLAQANSLPEFLSGLFDGSLHLPPGVAQLELTFPILGRMPVGNAARILQQTDWGPLRTLASLPKPHSTEALLSGVLDGTLPLDRLTEEIEVPGLGSIAISNLTRAFVSYDYQPLLDALLPIGAFGTLSVPQLLTGLLNRSLTVPTGYTLPEIAIPGFHSIPAANITSLLKPLVDAGSVPNLDLPALLSGFAEGKFAIPGLNLNVPFLGTQLLNGVTDGKRSRASATLPVLDLERLPLAQLIGLIGPLLRIVTAPDLDVHAVVGGVLDGSIDISRIHRATQRHIQF